MEGKVLLTFFSSQDLPAGLDFNKFLHIDATQRGKYVQVSFDVKLLITTCDFLFCLPLQTLLASTRSIHFVVCSSAITALILCVAMTS